MKDSAKEFSKQFKESDAPRSPEALDQRILEHARRHQPAPRSYLPRWVNIAAAVSVAGLASLLVIQPQSPSDFFDNATRPSLEQSPAELHTESASANEVPTKVTNRPIVLEEVVVTARKKQAAEPLSDPSLEMKIEKPLIVEEAIVSSSQVAEAKPEQLNEVTVTKQKHNEALQDSPASVAVFSDSDAIIARTQPSALTPALSLSAASTNEEADSNNDRSLDELAVPPFPATLQGVLLEEALLKQLKIIDDLLSDGRTQVAQQRYQKLLEACPHCQLPDSMDKALLQIKSVSNPPP